MAKIPRGYAKSDTVFWILFAVSLSTLITRTNSRFTSAKEEKLLRGLLKNKLTKNSPPAGIVNDTVFVYMDLYQIINIQEKNGILTLKLWMYIYYNLKEPLWESSNFSGVRTMQFPMDSFWKPDIVPLDAMEVKYESYNYQAVSSQGAVAAWSSLITVKFSCSLDVTNFPFDKHECPLRFGQWLSQNDEYKLGVESTSTNGRTQVELAFYKPHDQWKLITPLYFEVGGREIVNLHTYSDVILTIKIKRLPLFYAVIVLLPGFLLYFLSPFVFLLPVESGEKISMTITLLLAQVVSMGAIQQVLPESSTNFPVIAYFLALSILQMCVDLILTVIVINIHGLDGAYKVPECIKRMLSGGISRSLLIPSYPVNRKQSVMLLDGNPVRSFESSFKEISPVLRFESKSAADTTKGSSESDTMPTILGIESPSNMIFMWKTFSVLLDRVLFVLNFVGIIITCLVFGCFVL